MTVTSTTARVDYLGNGVATTFAYPFKIFSPSDLRVVTRDTADVERVLVLGTDYTVNTSAGSITLAAALADGYTLTIRRVVPLTQGTSFRNNGTFFPGSHEDALDRLTMVAQDQQDDLGRALRLPDTFDAIPALPAPEGGKALVWNVDGTRVENRGLDGGVIALPGAGRTVATVSDFLNNNARYNPLDYGALGGGVVDEGEQIQRMLDLAGPNATIVFPYGRVWLTKQTLVLHSGQTIVIEGEVVFNPDTPSPLGSAAFSNHGCTVAGGYTAEGNITILGPGTIRAPGGSGIMIAHADGVRVQGVRFVDWYHHMVDLPGCKNVHVEGNTGTNSVTANANGSGIQIDQAVAASGAVLNPDGSETTVFDDGTGCRDVLVRGNVIEVNTQSWGLHLHRSGSAGVVFDGNIVRSCKRGFTADPSVAHADLVVSNNQFVASIEHGIAIEATLTRARIAGNVVNGVTSGNGIWCENAAGGSTDVVIEGNTVSGAPASGIRLRGASNFAIANNSVAAPSSAAGSRGIAVVDSSNGTVSGNAVDMAKTSGVSVIPGIYVVRNDSGTTTAVQITGNHVRRAYRGIWVTNAARAVSVMGNVISASLDRGILMGDTLGGFTVAGCTISGNTIDDVGVSGIVLENPSGCAIAGNVVRGVTGSAGSGRGIQLFGTGTYNIVSGNTVDGVTTTAQFGILIATTYTTIIGNAVTRFLTGLAPSAPPLAGTIIANNILRGNTTDNSFSGADHFFVMNHIGDQTVPMTLKTFQLTNTVGGYFLSGAGTPEGAVTAPKGSAFFRTDGGTGTTLYVKESGTGNTGWVAK